MTINGPAAIARRTIHRGRGEKGHLARGKLGGTIQADILKEYIAQKEWIFPPRPHMRVIVDMIEFCTRRNAEMEYDLDLGISHPRSRIDGGARARIHARGRIRVRRSRHRAPVWTSIRSRRASRTSSTRTSTSSRRSPSSARRAASTPATCARSTARRIRNRGSCVSTRKPPAAARPRNSPRTTSCASRYEAMAAVLGGTQSLHTNSMDEVLALPTEKSVEIALRTQQVLAYETNVTNVVDPLGGSYFVEALTDEMERQAEAYFAQIAEYGGVVEAIEAGLLSKGDRRSELPVSASHRNERSRDRRRQRVRARRRSPSDLDLLKITEEMEREQARSLQSCARPANCRSAKHRSSACKRACRDPKDNLMPHLIDCVNAYCDRRRNRRSDGRGLRPVHRKVGLLSRAGSQPNSSAIALAARSQK